MDPSQIQEATARPTAAATMAAGNWLYSCLPKAENLAISNLPQTQPSKPEPNLANWDQMNMANLAVEANYQAYCKRHGFQR
jgi:hypothetical protein